jgi:hypothetical protein
LNLQAEGEAEGFEVGERGSEVGEESVTRGAGGLVEWRAGVRAGRGCDRACMPWV